MNSISYPYIPGRMKGRLGKRAPKPEPKLTDRDVLLTIAEAADVLNAERIAGGLWLLVPVPLEVVEYLAQVGADTEDMEPDQDEGGTENGRSDDDEPDDEDTDVEDQVFDPITQIIGRRDAATCEDFEPSCC